MTDIFFIRRLLIALALLALAVLLWRLTDLWLLIFGSVLVAIILRSAAKPFERYWPPHWSMAAAGLAIIVILGLLFWLVGSTIGGQIDQLSQQVPQAWSSFKHSLQSSRLGNYFLHWISRAQPDTGIFFHLSQITVGVLDGAAELLLVIFAGIYLAARPHLYLRGLKLLLPPGRRPEFYEVFYACGQAIRLWLLGQLIYMATVGALIGLGLWLIGLPSALGLGLLAGLGEFVPYAGIVLAFFPAMLLALSQGTSTAWWTLAVYVVAVQFEGHVTMPLVQQKIVSLPPALLLFSLLAFFIVFGPLGLLFAAPLTVVTYVVVNKLYVRDVIGEKTTTPGDST